MRPAFSDALLRNPTKVSDVRDCLAAGFEARRWFRPVAHL
jgi:hypothetical protein